MLPLRLVVGASERVHVDQCRVTDEPLWEIALSSCFPCEVTRRNRITVEHNGGHACRLELGDGLRRRLLDGARVECVRNRLGHWGTGIDHALLELIVRDLRGGAALEVERTKLAGAVHELVARMGCVLANELVLDQFELVDLGLIAAAANAPHIRISLCVEVDWLAGSTAHAQDLVSGKLISKCAVEVWTAPDHERLDLFGNTHRIGARSSLVKRIASANKWHKLHGAAVCLVIRFVVLDQVLHRLGDLRIGVGHLHCVSDVGHDRVARLALIHRNCDFVGGYALGGSASVIAGERHVTLRGEEVGNGDLARGGIAARAPVHRDASILGLREIHRIGNLSRNTGAWCRR